MSETAAGAIATAEMLIQDAMEEAGGAGTTVTVEPAPAPVPPPKPDLEEYDRETLRRINEMEKVVAAAESDHIVGKERASELKKRYEAKLDELRALIRERQERRGKPVQKTLVDDLPADGEPGSEPAAGEEDESWRDVPLSTWTEFGVLPKDLELLTKASPPITTVGQLADYTQPNKADPSYVQRLTDIDGIGPARAERVENANLAFWAKWNQRGEAAA